MAELTASPAMQKRLGATMRREAWWLAQIC